MAFLKGRVAGSFCVVPAAIILSTTSIEALSLETDGSSLAAPNTPVQSKEQAKQFFISQYHSRFNPQATELNGNCGPAALAMVAKYFEIVPPGLSSELVVEDARVAMTGRDNLFEFTDIINVVRGARKIGLKAQHVFNIDAMVEALKQGAILIVSGSPSVPGSYAARLKGFQHCRGGHFIVVAGRDGDKYIMSDPENPNGPNKVSRHELQRFMAFFPSGSEHGAVAIWR